MTQEAVMVLQHGNEQRLAIYHLAHDLRGPLNSILGFTELLIDGIEGPLNEYQIADITAINQSAHNLLRMINNLVDLSKVEANKLSLTTEAVDLRTQIKTIATFDYGTLKPEWFNIIVDVPENLPLISGQADRTEQILMGLVRFTFKMQTDQIIISAMVEDDHVVVHFDTGSEYISPEQQKQLFKLGTTVDSVGHTRMFRGGLEMPLLYWLAVLQQSTLWVESDPDIGTSFYLKLPCHGTSS